MHTLRFLSAVSSGLALASCLCASGPAVDYSISIIADSVAPSKTVAVPIAVMNSSEWTVEQNWPKTVPGTLVVSGARWKVELALEGDEDVAIWLAPHEFATRAYAFTIPEGASAGVGLLEARISGTASVRAGLIIESPGELQKSSSLAVTHQPTDPLVHPEPALNSLSRTFMDRVGPHEPIYFIYGPDDPAAKFQFSLKYKMLDLGSVDGKWASRSLQFGYTQCSLWDLGADSSPFYDTSYMPEIMFEALTPASDREGRVHWIGFQAGYKHESNGRDGPLSRSLDIAQVRAAVAFGDLDGWHAIVVPKLWTYLDTSDYNDDIEDYRGYGTLRVIVGRNDGPTLSVATWAGKDFDHASVQLDLNVPIRTSFLDLETYLTVQYFNGYGESLREYDRKSDTIRAGFAIVR